MGPVARPAAVPVSSGPSTASLLLIGLGVAAVALLVAVVISMAASGRRAGPETQTAGVAKS